MAAVIGKHIIDPGAYATCLPSHKPAATDPTPSTKLPTAFKTANPVAPDASRRVVS